MKVVINTSSFGKFDKAPLELLEQNSIEYSLNPFKRKLTAEEVKEIAKDAVGIIGGLEPLDKNVLESLPKLEVISRCGVGMDNVDQQAAKKLGIKVFNTPDGPTLSVAELTVGLILNLLRKTSLMDRSVRQGVWKKEMGNLLNGKKVGIVGFGRIGQKVAELLLSFGVEILYSDIQEIKTPLKCKEVELEELLKTVDIVSLHLAIQDLKEPFLGNKEFAAMKKGAWLVNVARGNLINEKALLSVLKDGHLNGAALDVFEQEPYEGPLKDCDNVILTPHVGSYAQEARVRMETETVENLLKGLTQ